jgi:hypothetical protein
VAMSARFWITELNTLLAFRRVFSRLRIVLDKKEYLVIINYVEVQRV